MILLVLVLLAPACGGGAGTPPAAPRTHATTTATVARETLPPRLRRDLRAIRAEAAKTSHNSLMGTPALQRATGRFLDDLARSQLSLGAQNRALDHAASAVAGSCDQCFQMIEATRPIPAIAH